MSAAKTPEQKAGLVRETGVAAERAIADFEARRREIALDALTGDENAAHDLEVIEHNLTVYRLRRERAEIAVGGAGGAGS